jgi:hypothetical protein
MSRYHLTGLLFELGGEPKGGTFDRFAFNADFALHEAHQLLGNGKAQAKGLLIRSVEEQLAFFGSAIS